ncbi:MAG TPA: S8 family serine peptidase [Thermoleophilaceae bacterium]|jgi:serine protease
MRGRLSILAAVLAAVLALATAGTAGAVTCSHPASAYATGAPGIGAAGGTTAVNDPFAPAQWGLAQVHAPAAWARGARGAGAVVAVLDSGVDLAHPDLAGKLLEGVDLVPGGSACPGPQDENGHGTHVAGIVGAVAGNGIGVAGTAPDASILPVRVLDPKGDEPVEGVVFEGIRWAADHGADVINLSLSGPPLLSVVTGSDAESAAAVDYAWSKGAVVVAAAGNDSFPLCNEPAAAQRAVCVAATDSAGAPSYYSNFPATPDRNVAVRAPGGEGSVFCEDSSDVWSTVWPGDSTDAGCGLIDGYETFAGTSMATPFVSGVAAMLAARGLTNAQIVECLRTTSGNHGAYDPAYGYGVVDADAAVAACAPSATAPFEPPAQPPPSSPGGGDSGSGPGSGGSGSSAGSSPDPRVTVRIRRTTRARLAKSGRLRFSVATDRAVKVTVRAVLSRTRRRGTAGRGSVTLRAAGSRSASVRLTRWARRELARHRRARLVLRWRGGTASGSAAVVR